MNLLTTLPLGDNSNTTLYVFLIVAAVCVVSIGVLGFISKRSKNKEQPENESHVEEISEE